jgi:membrane dipeptidase
LNRLRVTHAVLALVLTTPLSIAAQGPDPLDHARELMRETPLVDGHNDLPWQIRAHAGGDLDSLDIAAPQPDIMTDIGRLRTGRVGAQFWAAYVPTEYIHAGGAARFALRQIDLIHRITEKYPRVFEFAWTADDIDRIHDDGKIASMIGIEGGHAIENSLDLLRDFYRLGVRYMTLTHGENHDWADSATDEPVHDGLTPFGQLVVREMNRLGMFVDLSHVSEKAMHDVLDIAEAPVIFSHSSARALAGHPRNVPDSVLARLPENGGVVMVTFVPPFISQEVLDYFEEMSAIRDRLREVFADDTVSGRAALRDSIAANPAPRAHLSQVADHIDHIVSVASIDNLGIGSDFDGIGAVIDGLEDVSTFPALIAELIQRGYSDDDIRKILGENLLRAMRSAEAAAERLQSELDPIVADIPGELPQPLGYD